MHDRASFYVTRAFIGLFEGGFIPGTILMATYFYTSRELSVRLAAFWSTLNVASKSTPATSVLAPTRSHSQGSSPRSWPPASSR